MYVHISYPDDNIEFVRFVACFLPSSIAVCYVQEQRNKSIQFLVCGAVGGGALQRASNIKI